MKYDKMMLGFESGILIFLSSLIEGKVHGEESGESNVPIYLIQAIDNDYFMENMFNLLRNPVKTGLCRNDNNLYYYFSFASALIELEVRYFSKLRMDKLKKEKILERS
jgi:hypothetical protein